MEAFSCAYNFENERIYRLLCGFVLLNLSFPNIKFDDNIYFIALMYFKGGNDHRDNKIKT